MHPTRWPGALWRCGHVIWVCRVAVVSSVPGGYLLAYTVQARDLFADLGIRAWQWAVFLLLVFFWAWIVHAEGRRALQHDDWVPELQAGEFSPERRLKLQTIYWYPAVWLPRLFSLNVFVFVGIAIVRTYRNLSSATAGLPEASQAVSLALTLLVCSIAVALLYIRLIWKPREREDWIVPDTPTQWSHEPPLLAPTAPVLARLTGYTRPTPAVPKELVDRALSIARIVIVMLLVFTIFYPHFFATWWPRLFFVPILLGGAVVLLGEVAAWSMRQRTPLLLGVAVSNLILVYHTTSVRLKRE